MPNPKMLILRGNSAPAGNYPDESGNPNIAWPFGALHVRAACEYARRRGYEPVVLDKPGQPQSQSSPQATAAIKAFLNDDKVAAFYGFSGGGYNVRHILEFLASNKPETLIRIHLVVVIGSPGPHGKSTKPLYLPSAYSGVAKRKYKQWKDIDWEVVYRTNPVASQMPKDLERVSTHMFGPDILLAGWPEGVGT
ncbi:hypothetical protein [Bradyrhizobium sp. WSM1417]|uniref:hypothetical protein n=1 Tax=Bradyrhizobium sp. WSM1417 TaxID=754500 RepID=UPI0012EC5166|nr:hypothetical protein [Bradyrhizobium sp. WSM1417]